MKLKSVGQRDIIFDIAKRKEEQRAFFELVGDFLLQQKQKLMLERNIYWIKRPEQITKMDFNIAFGAYDIIEGTNCLTCLSATEHMSQKEATIEAVRQIGLNQIAEVKAEWFADDAVREMFFERLEVLKEAAVSHEWES